MSTLPRTLLVILLWACALFLIIWLDIFGIRRQAHAHDWYPIECCSSIDCAPVTSWSYVAGAFFDSQERKMVAPLARLVVTTSRGTFAIPDELPRRESRDNRMHVCNKSTGQVICVFMPPGM